MTLGTSVTVGPCTAADAETLRAQYWDSNQRALTLVAIVGHLGFNLAMPFLPLYLRDLGLSDPSEIAVWSGSIIAITPLVAGLMSPVWGLLGDRVGNKPLLARTCAASVVLYAMMGFVWSPLGLLILRALFGAVGGFGPLLVALTTSTSPRHHTSEAVGRVQSYQLASIALGPAIGGVLFDLIGMRASFVIAAGLYALGLLIIVRFVREVRTGVTSDRVAAQEPSRTPHGTQPQRARLHYLVGIAGILFLVTLVERTFGPVLPLFVQDLGAPAGAVATLSGGLIAAAGLASAFSARQVSRQAHRFGATTLLVVGIGVGAVVCVPMSLVQNLWQLVVLRVALALLVGGAASLCYVAAAMAGSRERTASALGLIASASHFAVALGGFSGGLIAAVNLRLVFVADAGFLVCAALLAWLLRNRATT